MSCLIAINTSKNKPGAEATHKNLALKERYATNRKYLFRIVEGDLEPKPTPEVIKKGKAILKALKAK